MFYIGARIRARTYGSVRGMGRQRLTLLDVGSRLSSWASARQISWFAQLSDEAGSLRKPDGNVRTRQLWIIEDCGRFLCRCISSSGACLLSRGQG